MNPQSFSTLNAPDAISVAWRHFSRQWVPWVLSVIALMATALVLGAVMIVVVLTTATTKTETTTFSTTQTTEPSGVGLAAMVIFYILIAAVAFVYSINSYRNAFRVTQGENSINSYRNAFRVTQGETIAVGDFFKFSGLATPLIVSILCGTIIYIGMLLFVIPGIIAMFALMYVPLAAAINNSTVGRAFSEGFAAFKNNIGQSILLAVLLGLIGFAGSLVLGIGNLVTIPLINIALVVGYLMVTGRNLVVAN